MDTTSNQEVETKNVAIGRFVTIALGSMAIVCLLGICIDMVTANVAVEYFSEKHPKIFHTDSPWLLALIWGIGASWWFGAIVGIVVATINRRRQRPIDSILILYWTTIACISVWLLMIAIMLAILAFASTIPVEIRRPTFDYDRRMVAVAMAHQFEYHFGVIATAIVAWKTWRAK